MTTSFKIEISRWGQLIPNLNMQSIEECAKHKQVEIDLSPIVARGGVLNEFASPSLALFVATLKTRGVAVIITGMSDVMKTAWQQAVKDIFLSE